MPSHQFALAPCAAGNRRLEECAAASVSSTLHESSNDDWRLVDGSAGADISQLGSQMATLRGGLLFAFGLIRLKERQRLSTRASDRREPFGGLLSQSQYLLKLYVTGTSSRAELAVMNLR